MTRPKNPTLARRAARHVSSHALLKCKAISLLAKSRIIIQIQRTPLTLKYYRRHKCKPSSLLLLQRLRLQAG